MEQKNCSLCEGKIVDGRCSECGMYYRKMEGRYFLNREREKREDRGENRLENTAASRQEKAEPYPKKQWEERTAFRTGRPQTVFTDRQKPVKKQEKMKVQFVGSLLTFVFLLFGAVVPLMDTLRSEPDSIPEPDFPEEIAAEEDIYANVERPLEEEGEELEVTLPAGRYLVGGHIPEGNYCVTGIGEWDSYFTLDDWENRIFHTWYVQSGEKENGEYEVADVRLYEGAVLQVYGCTNLLFYTENGQSPAMQTGQPNPLTEQVAVTEESQKAGVDFPAGTYDILMEGGLAHTVLAQEGWEERYLMDGEGDKSYSRFYNLKIPAGAEIFMETISGDEWKMTLIPSEEIFRESE